MELTKEHFDHVLAGLAGKDDLKVIKADVAAIKAGMAKLATQESVDDLSGKVTVVENLLNGHTTTLDAIAKDINNWGTEMTVCATA